MTTEETPGQMVTRSSPLMYEVDTGEHTWRRHVDQLWMQPTHPPDPGTNSEHSTATPTVTEEVPAAVSKFPGLTLNDSGHHRKYWIYEFTYGT